MNLIRYILPGLWGILAYNILRIVTDLAKKDEFWSGGIKLHAVGLSISIFIWYLISFLWRRRLQHIFRSATKPSVGIVREYIIALIQIVAILNPIALIAEHMDLVYMGDGFIDYILVNATYVPLLLLYYMFLRNEIINKNLVDSYLYVEKLKADKLNTELQLLKSQYHPHFLFNALNTIYFQIEESNSLAKRSVEQLSELLRYQIYNADEKVPMEQEVTFLKSYIAFQQQRLTERLILRTDFEGEWEGLYIYPLIFQPLIENAFKYVRGNYEIAIDLNRIGDKLHFIVTNTLAENRSVQNKGFKDPLPNSGSGLSNLMKRMELLYPNEFTLTTEVDKNFFMAELTITIQYAGD